MSQADVDAVASAYAAINAGDAGPYLELFDQEGEFRESSSLPYGGTYHGHEGLDRLFALLDEYWESLSFDVGRILDAGDSLVVVSRVSGRARKTGGTFDEPIVEVLRMRDGKIVSSHAYLDTARLLQALGMEATPAASDPS